MAEAITISTTRMRAARLASLAENEAVLIRRRIAHCEDVISEDDGPARMFAEARSERTELRARLDLVEKCLTDISHGVRGANEARA